MKRISKVGKLQPIEDIDTARVSAIALDQTQVTTEKHHIVPPQSKGQETCARVNALLKFSGVSIWLHTYLGQVRVIELRPMADESLHVYVLATDYRQEQRGFIAHWNTEFKLFLGVP